MATFVPLETNTGSEDLKLLDSAGLLYWRMRGDREPQKESARWERIAAYFNSGVGLGPYGEWYWGVLLED